MPLSKDVFDALGASDLTGNATTDGSYRDEAGLRARNAFTPEEQAENDAYERSPAVRAEFEAAIREEKDPKKRDILAAEFARDFGTEAPIAEGMAGVSKRSLVERAQDMRRSMEVERQAGKKPTFQPEGNPGGGGEEQSREANRTFGGDLKDALGQGYEQFKTGLEYPFVSDETYFKDLAADQKRAREKGRPSYVDPINEQVQRINEATGGEAMLGVARLFSMAFTNPKGFLYVTTENLANQISSLGGMAGGAIAGGAIGGPFGAVAGLVVGSLTGNSPEFGAKVSELIQQEAQRTGADITDPAQVEKILTSPGFREQAHDQGLTKWLTITGVDIAGGAFAGRMFAAPRIAFGKSVGETLTKAGVNLSDKAAVAAALKNPSVLAALKPAAERYAAASTMARTIARGAGAAGVETFGEGLGEYVGEGFASGEFKLGDAALEAMVSMGTSVATPILTGEALSGFKGADDALVQAALKAKPIPNSPLTTAAQAGQQATQQAAQQAGAAAAAAAGTPNLPAVAGAPEESGLGGDLKTFERVLGTTDLLRAIRADADFGPDAVKEVLYAYNVARNPEVPLNLRQQAMDGLKQFMANFRNKPDFVMSQPEPAAPTTALAPQPGGPVVPARQEINMGDAQRVNTLPRQMLEDRRPPPPAGPTTPQLPPPGQADSGFIGTDQGVRPAYENEIGGGRGAASPADVAAVEAKRKADLGLTPDVEAAQQGKQAVPGQPLGGQPVTPQMFDEAPESEQATSATEQATSATEQATSATEQATSSTEDIDYEQAFDEAAEEVAAGDQEQAPPADEATPPADETPPAVDELQAPPANLPGSTKDDPEEIDYEKAFDDAAADIEGAKTDAFKAGDRVKWQVGEETATGTVVGPATASNTPDLFEVEVLTHPTLPPHRRVLLKASEMEILGEAPPAGTSTPQITYSTERDEDDEGTFAVAKSADGKWVGHLHVPDSAVHEGGFDIGDVQVEPQLRRQGIATALLSRMEEELGKPATGANSVFTNEGRLFFNAYKGKRKASPEVATPDQVNYDVVPANFTPESFIEKHGDAFSEYANNREWISRLYGPPPGSSIREIVSALANRAIDAYYSTKEPVHLNGSWFDYAHLPGGKVSISHRWTGISLETTEDALKGAQSGEQLLGAKMPPKIEAPKAEIKSDIDKAAHDAANSTLNDTPQPTQAQKDAGNYKKGHITINGLDISIENPRGSVRWKLDIRRLRKLIGLSLNNKHNTEESKPVLISALEALDKIEGDDVSKVAEGFKELETAISAMSEKWPQVQEVAAEVFEDGWMTPMAHHYGYIKGTVGRDKDHIDIFLTDGAETAQQAWVIDQINKDGSFDEHKVVLGPETEAEARKAYLDNYEAGWTGLGAITSLPMSAFRPWAKSGMAKKPLSYVQKTAEPEKTPAPDGMTENSAAMPKGYRMFENWDGVKSGEAHEIAIEFPDGHRESAWSRYSGNLVQAIEKQLPATLRDLKGMDDDVLSFTGPDGESDQAGTSDEETKQIGEAFDSAEQSQSDDEFQVTHIFDAPKKDEIVRLQDKVKVYNEKHGWMTVDEAKAKIEEWKQHADKQGEASANFDKVVLSFFDRTGMWSEPWEVAGYQVWRFDIQNDEVTGDVNNFSTEFFNDWFGDFDGNDVYAILAACPCTDFANSGAKHFAAKDADGRTRASVELVRKTLEAIEYFKPQVWAIENPVGRIERLTGLPPWRLAFNPNHIGDPYTKKTLLWGRFNADLPIAPVEPTEGSKMHSKYGGKSLATKNARSVTPEGFAYSFFMSNNAIDHPVMAIANKYDRLDREKISKAVDAGVTEKEISNAVDDFYYMDLDDDAANAAIDELTQGKLEQKGQTDGTQAAETEQSEPPAPQEEVKQPDQHWLHDEIKNLIFFKGGTKNRKGLDKLVELLKRRMGGEDIAPAKVKSYLVDFAKEERIKEVIQRVYDRIKDENNKAAAVKRQESANANRVRFISRTIDGQRVAEPVRDFKDITFPELPGRQFFIHPIGNGLYGITERETGFGFARGISERVAMKAAADVIALRSREDIEKIIDAAPKLTIDEMNAGLDREAQAKADAEVAKKQAEDATKTQDEIAGASPFTTRWVSSKDDRAVRSMAAEMTAYIDKHTDKDALGELWAGMVSDPLPVDGIGSVGNRVAFILEKTPYVVDIQERDGRERQTLRKVALEEIEAAPSKYHDSSVKVHHPNAPTPSSATTHRPVAGPEGNKRFHADVRRIFGIDTEDQAAPAALTQAMWDAMDYGKRQDIAQASDLRGMRKVIHRVSGSRWTELGAGERESLIKAYAASSTPAAPQQFPGAEDDGDAEKRKDQAHRTAVKDLLGALSVTQELINTEQNSPENFDIELKSQMKKWFGAEIGKAVNDNDSDRAKALSDMMVDGKVILPKEFYDTARKVVQKEIKRRDFERIVDESRAVLAGVLSAYEDEQDKRMITEGWDHALSGKTRSTLPSSKLHQEGYDAARGWMKTPEGRDAFAGKRGKKLEDTGIDLRRWFDGKKKEISGDSAAGVIASLDAITSRAELLRFMLPESATPGARRWLDAFRNRIIPFKEWAIESRTSPLETLYGSYYGRSGNKEKIENYLNGKTYQPNREDDTFAQRVEVLRDTAEKYVMRVDRLVKVVNGRTVDELATKLSEAIGNKDAQNFAYWNLTPSEFGQEIKPIFRDFSADVFNFSKHSKGSKALDLLTKDESRPYETTASTAKLIRPRLDKITRQAKDDTRGTENVTPAQFKATFEFGEGRIFGNWVKAKQDQDHLNYSFDAFHDLAVALGLPDAAMSLGGRLFFTIGKLGHGKHAAHYQQAQADGQGGVVSVINVTNTKGDGTVAHEWAHALDLTPIGITGNDTFAKIGGDPPYLARAIAEIKANLRFAYNYDKVRSGVIGFLRKNGTHWRNDKRSSNTKEGRINAAVRAVDYYAQRRYQMSKYYLDAFKLDKKTASVRDKKQDDIYWANDKELFARAFEAWMGDHLEGQNDYLVNTMWTGEGMVTEHTHRGTPFPIGEERKRFARWFDALAKSLRYDAKAEVVYLDSTAWSENKPNDAEEWKKALAELETEIPSLADAIEEEQIQAEAEQKRWIEESRKMNVGDIVTARDPNSSMGRFGDMEVTKVSDRDWASGSVIDMVDREGKTRSYYGQYFTIVQTKADRDRIAAAEAAKQKEEPTPPSDPVGDLNEEDYEKVFDEAADLIDEQQAEEPDAPPPAVDQLKDSWTQEDMQFVRDKIVAGQMVLFSAEKWVTDRGLPIIQDVGNRIAAGAKVDHSGFGVFDVKGGGLEASFIGGMDMSRTPGGHAYTVLSVSSGTVDDYPWDVVRTVFDEDAANKEKIKNLLGGRGGRIETDAERDARNAEPTLDEAAGKSAADAAKEFAKHGVTGIDEALKGLVKLFGGGPGRLMSFPAGMDRESYNRARPHFRAALEAARKAGMALKDFFSILIKNLGGIAIKPYVIHFAKQEGLTHNLGSNFTATRRVAHFVAEALDQKEAIDWKDLFAESDVAWGGTQAEGKYTVKDAYDAMELGVNLYLAENAMSPAGKKVSEAVADVRRLGDLLKLLPTQTKRTAEMDEFQQFSTPPTLAYVANWVASVRIGDSMMEPSAGTGDLAIFAQNAGANLILNELSGRRADILQDLFPKAQLFRENAEQLNNILPKGVVPTVVVMNPPFSATGGRVTGQRNTMNGGRHIEQALARLAPGGRLVAIVGEGMAADRPAFKDWWNKISATYNVRANIGINGNEYVKYGTTFDNQILVIDKTGPTTGTVVTGKVESVADLPALLEGIRNDRPQADAANHSPQPGPDQPTIDGPTESGGGADQPGNAGGGPATTVGAGSGNSGRGGRSGGSSGRGTSRSGKADAADDGERRGGQDQPDAADGSDGSGGKGVGGTDQLDGGAGESGVTLGKAEQQSSKEELTDAIFEPYRPQRLKVEGAQPHPGKLVQSAAMSAVEPPAPTYVPNLPRELIDGSKPYTTWEFDDSKGRGKWVAKQTKGPALSDAQIESVVYAGQQHEQFLPNGERRGFFIGDGTGVGKGREIAAIILDNIRQGRKKAIWISYNQGLLHDAKRDVSALGIDPAKLFWIADAGSANLKIKHTDGVLFSSYATFAKGESQATEEKAARRSRIDQIIEWFGEDYDGVIVFDEAHSMGNALQTKGSRGKKQPSQQALAGLELQARLPQARIVYVSATGAAELNNLAYSSRLGLWGENTSFSTVLDFIGQVSEGGVAAMELISRDMKAMGMYIARSLSFEGVTYERMENELSPLQVDMYNELARAWQIVLQNINEALEITGQAKNKDAKSQAMGRFWGSHQRFFNQIITSMQTPYVIDDIRRQLDEGNSILIQLVNTNEAEQSRQEAKAKEDDVPLEELDFTPRQTLIDMVTNGFPVQAYEEVDDGKGGTVMRPVKDADGNPVFDADAIAMRDALVKNLEDIRVPGNPMDEIIEAFGVDMVAEVTGRKKRFLAALREEDGARTLIEQSRGKNANLMDAAAFQSGKKRILIFSQAGGTGFSFHADNTKANKQRRVHYILQPGWRADVTVQGFGRSHRSNEASQPHYVLPTTNLKAQKRFVSSIARRLDQLGALTRGQRQASGAGLFTAADNLESGYAKHALRNLFVDMYHGRTPLQFSAVTTEMGLNGLINEDTGALNESRLPDITRFLNRLLSLTVERQDEVFQEFEARLTELIEIAIQNGSYDSGLQTLKAKSVVKTRDDVAFTDDRTKAQTRYVELGVTNPLKYRDFDSVSTWAQGYGENNDLGWFLDTDDRVVRAVSLGKRVNAKGETFNRGALRDIRDDGHSRYVDDAEAYIRGYRYVMHHGKATRSIITRLNEETARAKWEEQIAAAPKEKTTVERMIVGVILPVWEKIIGEPKIFRVQTDEGERMIGRFLSKKDSDATLKNLGVGSTLSKLPIRDIIRRIMGGDLAILANAWKIRRVTVSNDTRMEIEGNFTGGNERELVTQGAIQERIGWRNRYFIPTGPDGEVVFERITKTRAVVDLIGKDGKSANDSTDDDGAPMVTEPQSAAYTVNESDGISGDVIQEVGNALPAKQGTTRRPQARAANARADRVLAVREAPDEPGIYHVTTQLVTVGERQLPVDRVTTWDDAAQVFAHLSRYAVEHLDGLVTDKDGKPLAIIGAFKGAPTQATAYPSTMLMELARIDGAANLWIAHNHPSGLKILSHSDRSLSSWYEKTLRNSSVKYHGIAAVARTGGAVKWSAEDGPFDDTSGETAIDPSPKFRIPIVEREIIENNPSDSLSSPVAANSIVPRLAGDNPGIVFLTAQNQVSAFVPFDPAAMGALRASDNLVRLFRSAAKAGATAAVVAMPDGKVSRGQLNNLAGALGAIDVKVLDGIEYSTASGNPRSLAQDGRWDAAESRGLQFAARDSSVVLTGASVAEIRGGMIKAFGEKSIRQLEENGRIQILNTSSELREIHPNIEPGPTDKALFVNDTAYFFADRMSPATAHRELLHEIGEHYGLERMLGRDGYDNLIKAVQDLRESGDKHATAAWDFVREQYPEEREGGRRFMHEVLAQLGQNADVKKSGWWNDLIAAVKRFLVKMGFTGMIRIPDIQDMVMHSLKVAAQPDGRGPGGGVRAEPAMASQSDRSIGHAGWTQSRIDSLLRKYAVNFRPNATKAYAGWIRPMDFVRATTPAGDQTEQLRSQITDLDPQQLANEDQEIYLDVDTVDGTRQAIRGHEGRHRAWAMANAGVSRIPVVLYMRKGYVHDGPELSRMVLDRQRFGRDLMAAELAIVSDLVPIDYNHRDALIEKFSTQAEGLGGVMFSRTPREEGIPPGASRVLSSAKYETDVYKEHPDFDAAKKGDPAAALRFVRAQVARSTIAYAKYTFGKDAIYVAPHAQEVAGKNRIPITLAEFYAKEANGIADDNIYQTNVAGHTNATMMDRLLSRALFDGKVLPNRKYILVDDVATSGGTLAELADYIRSKGGIVLGMVTLADASQTVTMRTPNETIQSIKRKFGDAIERYFRIKPEALTYPEAEYLDRIPDADTLRARIAASGQAGRARLAGEGAGVSGAQDKRPLAARGNYADQLARDAADALREQAPAPLDQAYNAVRDPESWYRPLLNRLAGALKGSDKFGWLDKSIHTQLHKAQKNRYFGEVFRRAQYFMADASRAALRPAEMAPTVLPRIDVAESMKPAFNALFKGRAAADDIDSAFSAALRGTLDDTIYVSADEAGLTEEQFRIYREYRDSIDASLNELAAAEAWGVAREFFLENKRMTRAGQAMKKQMLDNPTEARDILTGALEQLREQTKLRFDMLTAAARDEAPFVLTTDNPVADLERALASGIGNAVQNGKIKAALDAAQQLREIESVLELVTKIFDRRDKLQSEGYAPLMRFGQHYLTIDRLDPTTGEVMVDENGQTVVEYFGLFESEAERNKAEDGFRALYADNPFIRFDSGTMSEESWRLYRGVSPESVALFAGKLGIGKDEVFQEWYRNATASRSALKRLIHRKGTPGFSEDGSRVLASFLTSNGRRASMLYHLGDIQDAIDSFPKQQGAEKDEAIKLQDYIQHPEEEAHKTRALMFMHFLGGTLSNFFINATQPAMVTLPFLSKFVGGQTATRLIKEAYGLVWHKERLSQDLKDALDRAEQEGKVGAQEIHHLWQETARPLVSSLGRFGENTTYRAHAFMQLWGTPFALAEHLNRQVTFIAAFQSAIEQGMTKEQAYSRGVDAVDQTQFVYNKSNRPNWGRGSIGSVIFTFKLFALSYTELLVRMLRESKDGRKAALFMLGMLFLASGLQGLPGADDLDDLIDTIAQSLGYNVASRQAKRKWLENLAGKDFAEVMLHGLSAMTPLDIQGRMSLGNLIPGSAMFKPSEGDRRFAGALEIVGPIGGLAQSYMNTVHAAQTGNWDRAAIEWMPKAIKDIASGYQMATTGEARDSAGRKVSDVGPIDALVKAVGFNPQVIASESRKTWPIQQRISYAKQIEGEIAGEWARGIVEGDREAIAQARAKEAEWNTDNPETPIRVQYSQVARRVKAMRATKQERLIKSATRETREFAKESIE